MIHRTVGTYGCTVQYDPGPLAETSLVLPRGPGPRAVREEEKRQFITINFLETETLRNYVISAVHTEIINMYGNHIIEHT